MEYLGKQDQKRRTLLSESGNEVLRLSYPVVVGDTPAALHVAAMVGALVGYAEREALGAASAALSEAAKNGRLFDFTCHTFDISLHLAPQKTHVMITLEVEFSNGKAPIFSRNASLFWEKGEQFQLPKTPRARKGARKNTPQ